MLSLLNQCAASPEFADRARLRQLLLGEAASLGEAAVEAGHRFAQLQAAARHSPALAAQNRYFGLDHAVRVAQLATRLDEENLAELGESLTAIGKGLRLVRSSIVESDEAHLDRVQATLLSATESLPRTNDMAAASSSETAPDRFKAFIGVPLDGVNNVALSVPTPAAYDHPDRAALQALGRILSTEFLHREVREKGGAYGGGASHSLDGALNFYSYRDPHLQATIDTFASSMKWCQEEEHITDSRLDQALLSIFASIDAPRHPSAQGQLHFLAGISPDLQRQHRHRLLSLTPSKVVEVAKKYLSNFDVATASIAVVGSDAEMERLRADPAWQVTSLAALSKSPSSPSDRTPSNTAI